MTLITPARGPTRGGTLLRITGELFPAAATVLVGGRPATDVQVVSQTEILAVTPAGDAGPVRVVIRTGGAQQLDRDTVWSGWFVYEQPGQAADVHFEGPFLLEAPDCPGRAFGFADLDLDGDLDLVAFGPEGVLVGWCSGPGRHQLENVAPQHRDWSGYARLLRVADVTGSGWPDLILGDIFLAQQEPGSFTDQLPLPPGTLVELDGTPPIELVQLEGDSLRVLRWRGAAFEVVQEETGAAWALGQWAPPVDLAPFDVGSDGDLDLVLETVDYLLSGARRAIWLLENQDGRLTAPRLLWSAPTSSPWVVDHAAHAFDGDGDGSDDLLLAGGSSDTWPVGQVSLFQDAAAGGATPSTTSFPELRHDFVRWGAWQVVDRDRDGRDELYFPRGAYAEDLWVRLGADGLFSSLTRPGCWTGLFEQFTWWQPLVDTDGDGELDRVAVWRPSSIWDPVAVVAAYGRTGGEFAVGRPIGSPPEPSLRPAQWTEVVDLDRDGHLDLVNQELEFAFGTAAGEFNLAGFAQVRGPGPSVTRRERFGPALADLDGDGRLEAVAGPVWSGYDQAKLVIRRCDGRTVERPLTTAADRVWGGDADGDGRDELLVESAGALHALIDPLSGEGPAASRELLAAPGLHDLRVLRDLDGTTLLVLLEHEWNVNMARVRVVRREAAGYVAVASWDLQGRPDGIDAELDEDGVLHIAVAPLSSAGPQATLLTLRGATLRGEALPGLFGRPDLGDVNGDGVLDLLIDGRLVVRDRTGEWVSSRRYLSDKPRHTYVEAPEVPSRIADLDHDGVPELVGWRRVHRRTW